MTDEQDLGPRWRESDSDAPSKLRDLLTEARSDLPLPGERARLETKLASLLTAAVPLGTDATSGASHVPDVAGTTPPAGGLAAASKVVGLLLGVGIAAGGAWWLTSSHHEVSTQTTAPRGAQVPETRTTSTPNVAPPTASTSATERSPEPEAAAEASAQPKAQPPQPSNASSKAGALNEARLLEQARAALSKNPERALELTEKHRQLYPRGSLSEEREVIAIEALKRSGQSGDARSRSERFEKSYPDSVHRDSIQR